MVNRLDAATKSRARQAFRALLASGAGKRLPSKRQRLSSRRLAFSFFGITGGLAALALIGLGVLSFRLARGPIALDSLTPRIEASLDERFGGQYSFQLGPTALERGETGITLSFGGVVIRDAAGRTLVAAPKGEVGLDLLALAGFSIRAKRLELVGLDLRLAIRPDGSLSVSAGETPGDAKGVSLDFPLPDASQTSGPNHSLVGALASRVIDALTTQNLALDRFGVAHGRLTVDDQTIGQKAHFNDVNIDLDRSQGAAALKLSARGPAGPWSLAIQARKQGAGALEIEAHDLNLADILLATGAHSFPFETDMPISFKIDMQTGADRALAAMEGRVSLGAGYFKLEDPDAEPQLVDEATGGFHWDPAAQRFDLEDFQIFEGKTHILFGGAISPPAVTNPAWVFALDSTDTVFAGERPGEKPIRLDKSLFEARYTPGEKRFVLDNFSIAGPGAQGALKGEVDFTGQGPTLKLDLSVGEGPLLTVARLWPSFIVADVRAWILENVKSGELASGALSIDWDAPTFAAARAKKAVPRDSVRGKFAVRDITARVMAGVPPIAELDGSGVVSARDVTLNAPGGYMEVSPGKRLNLTDIAFAVLDTTPQPLHPAQASAHFAGGVETLAQLMSLDPLKGYLGLPVDPASAHGRVEGKLGVDLQLGKDAPTQNIAVHANATLSDLQIDKFIGKDRLENGSMTISLEGGAMKLAGQGKLLGSNATIEMTKGADDDGQIQIGLTLDDAARAKKGFGLASVTGPIGVRLKTSFAQTDGEVDLDLTRVAIDNPAPGLSKPAGKTAKASFAFKTDAAGTTLSNIVYEAAGAAIKGSAQLSSEGSLVSAKLSQVRFSSGDDLKADISASDGGYKILVRGASLDARPILKSLLAAGPPSDAKNLDLDVKIASVVGADEQALSHADITLVRREGSTVETKLDATLGGGPLTVRRDSAGVLRVRGADAGALLKFLNLYPHMLKGTLDLVMRDRDGRQDGEVNVKDFVLRDEPALRKLVAAGHAPSAQRAGAAASVDPNAIAFEKLTARFSRVAGRIDFSQAAIYDPQMGLTADGYIDYARDRVEIAGTFVPAYNVNNLVTHIPVVGMLLGGGAHEGLFGVNYRISGPASAPVLAVNPLSAIAPGFLRKIFGAVDGALQPSDDSPAQAGSGAQQ